MKLRILSRADILSLITMRDAIDAMARAFGQLTAGAAEMPVRGALTTGDGISLFMPARLGATGERGAKSRVHLRWKPVPRTPVDQRRDPDARRRDGAPGGG